MRSLILLVFLSLISLVVAEYRSIDGSNNNLNHPDWGAANTLLISPEGVEYADGYNLPVTTRPNERIVSNVFLADDVPPAPHDGFASSFYTKAMRREGLNPDPTRRNTLSVIFGQFVGHDHSLVDLVFGGPGTVGSLFIPIVEMDDPLYQVVLDPNTGNNVTRNQLFARVSRRGPDATNSSWFPFNMNTAWLDLSQIYGSTDFVADGVRAHVDGKLKTDSQNDELPFLHETNSTNECGGPNFDLLSLPSGSGDARVDENPTLTALHSLFFLNHNRLCDELISKGYSSDDEELFQKARSLNIAVYQNIIYKEYLPITFGDTAVDDIIGNYQGYDSSVDGRITNAYTIAANRFGHDQVNLPTYLVHENCSLAAITGTLGVPEQERPNCIFQTFRAIGTSTTLESAAFQNAQKADHKVADLMRNIIFNIGGGNTANFNMDIEAANVFRARENGVPNYYALRKYHTGEDLYQQPGCSQNPSGPDPIQCFSYITSNLTAATDLQTYYEHIDNIDPFIGLLLEDKYDDDSDNMGKTLTIMVLDQFKRSRDGDRFWWESPNSGLTLLERLRVRLTSMRDVIICNTDADVPFPHAFKVRAHIPSYSCHHSNFD